MNDSNTKGGDVSVAERVSKPEALSTNRPPARRTASEQATRTGLLGALLVVMCLYFAARNGGFFTHSNLLIILANASVIGIVSIGQLFTVVSGGFDLSVGGIVPMCSVLFAMRINDHNGTIEALLLTLALGAAVGMGNGLIISLFRINPLVATLGTLSITGGLALSISHGVDVPFSKANTVLSQNSLSGVSNSVWIWAAIAAVALAVLRYTLFGRNLYATGGNAEAARLAGIQVRVVTTGVYVFSGALAGLAGAVLASELQTGSGTSGANLGLQTITAVILGGAALAGGVGGVTGTIVGVLILGVLENGMTLIGIASFYQTIATGVALLLAVGLSQIKWRKPSLHLNRNRNGVMP